MAKRGGIYAAPNELRGLVLAIEKMDKQANKELKDEVKNISQWYAQELIQASYSAPMPAQAAIVASSIKYNRDRIPNVTIGGTRGRKTRGTRNKPGVSAGVLLKGNEFGAYPTSAAGAFPNGGRRFPYRSPQQGRGNAGYWIYPTLRRVQPELTRKWKTAVEKVLDNWKKV